MLYLVAIAVAISVAYGAPVSFEKAQSIAQKHSGAHGGKIKHALASRTLSAAPYFVFEKENDGFIIVSADDIAVPILGEVNSGSFDREKMPPAMLYLLGTYERQIEEAINNGGVQDSETKKLWEQVQNPSSVMSAPAPLTLLPTKWNQGTPYNLFTPIDGGRRSETGCVAVVMSQIMRYWQHPTCGTGSSAAYTTRDRGIQVPAVEFGCYDYENMLGYYTANDGTEEQREAVAKLMYHSGVSVKMDYSATGSGAYAYDVHPALTEYFDYDSSIRYIDNNRYNLINDFTASDWKELVIGQIENNAPVYYGGQDVGGGGGHAFVIDGYNSETDRFHVNWGWSGSYDGFFPLTALNPNAYKFNEEQHMTINIMPNQHGNPPSQIRVSSFDVSTEGTSISAKVNAKMNFGVNFSGKIGLALISDNAIDVVLDSAGYSVANEYSTTSVTLPIVGKLAIYSCKVKYKEATLGKDFGADVPAGALVLQVVTKRGSEEWTPVGEQQTTVFYYTLTYNLDGGANNSANPATYTARDSVALQPPVREGYTFGGWFDNAAFSGAPVTAIPSGSAGNKTYWAKWTLNVYTVVFDANGGRINAFPETFENGALAQAITGEGWQLVNLPTPTRDGYTFNGWFTTGGAEITASTVFNSDTTVYANWTSIITPTMANHPSGKVTVRTTGNAIILENLPAGQKVEVYGLNGKRVWVQNIEPVHGVLRIPIHTKGVYIVRVGAHIISFTGATPAITLF